MYLTDLTNRCIMRSVNNPPWERSCYTMEITAKTVMGDMLEYDRGLAYILMQCGMHCVGCPSSIEESLEDACAVHGLDVNEVLGAIQEYLDNRPAETEE